MRNTLPLRSGSGLLCILLASTAISGEAVAQKTAAAPISAKKAPVVEASAEDEIIVTGQAVPGAVIGDVPPENQIRQAEIASYGVDSVSDLLAELADQTTSIAGRDASSGPVVLVNGKRVSGVNEVGDLPVESVLRVDILPEEVAIKYGYDAQAKVVNIILKRRFKSRVANLGGGMAAQGGGGQGSGAFTYTQIHDNDRLNLTGKVDTQAAILESDRGIAADPASGVTPAGGIADETANRTLQASTRNYALGAGLAHELSATSNASFNLKGTYATSRGLDGLATGDLTIPADNPYSDGTETPLKRYLSTDPLRKATNSGSVSAGGTLNVDLSTRWKLSVIGSYAHSQSETRSDNGYDISALQAALDGGNTAVDPYATLSGALLGNMVTNRANANSDTGSASVLLFGKLLKLPAGDLGVSLKLGGDFTAQSSTTVRDGLTSSGDANRTNGSARLSVDVPLTSRSKGVLGGIGTISLNLNGGITQVSDYGTLGTFGYGVNWAPVTGVSVIASVNQDRSAPTVAQLGNPVTISSNQRVYDYVTGQTVLVTSVTGGNAGLKSDDRHVFRLGVNAKLTSEPKLNFTASYVDSRNRNAVMSLGGVTAAVEDAFPDRFMRDAGGTLVEVDARPVNIYRQRTEQLRWGFNFSAQLRKAKRPERRSQWRSSPGAGEERTGPGRWGPQGQETHEPGGEAKGLAQLPEQQGGQQGEGNEITVNGSREDRGPDGAFPGGPPPDGFGPPPGDGPPPDGFGPPPGGGPEG
ncbi:TonB-dependent receptor, partial [Novosphingobium sp. 18050]|uniref:TonB-dependent receptor n=1 Tax=Novosphingobium sp. 18050 TaxID=2681398 RepID=UPI0013592C6B